MANSYIDYTGNGSLTTFTAPSYLEKTHIQVTVDGVVKTLNTDYSIADGSTSVVFGTAPAAASEIRISRSSNPAQRLTDYTNASLLTADAMDRDANQLFFLAQEAVDAAEKTDFGAQTFYSSGTTDPSTANAGDLFFNSQTGLLKIYNGSAWESVNNRGHKQTFAISGSTTVFTPSNPVDVNTLVFLNGVLLVKGSDSDGDYTTSSTQVTLNVAVTSGVVEIISFPNAAFVGTVNAVDGVFSGDLTCDDLTTASLSLTYTPSFGFLSAKTILRETASGNFRIEGEDLQLNVSDGTSPSFGNNAVYKRIDCEAGSTGSVEIYHGANAKKLETTATGIDVTGTVAASDGLTADYIDLTGGKSTTTTGAICADKIRFSAETTDEAAIYASVDGLNTSLFIQSADDVNDKVRVVAGGTESLTVANTGIDVTGEVKGDSLFIDNSNGLNTAALVNSSTGRSMLNVISTFEGTVSEQEASIEIGANKLAFIDFKTPDTDDYDLRIYHSEPENLSMVNSLNDNLFLRSGGKVALQHNYGDTKLETTSTGIDVTGTVTADGLTLGAGEIATFNSGAGGDLQISGDATGSFSLIKQTGGGDLIIQGQNGSLRNDADASLLAWDADNVNLSWQGATGAGTKLATTETGIDVTGTVEADDIILSSPNGTRYRITVANDGTLTTTAV